MTGSRKPPCINKWPGHCIGAWNALKKMKRPAIRRFAGRTKEEVSRSEVEIAIAARGGGAGAQRGHNDRERTV